MQISAIHRYTVHICAIVYSAVWQCQCSMFFCEECYRLPSQEEKLDGFCRIGAKFNFFAKSGMKNKKDPILLYVFVDSTQ